MVDTVNRAVLPPPSDTDPQYIKNIRQIWADKAEQERLAMERARAVDLYSKATDGVKYNSYSEEIEEPTTDPTIGYSPEYFASERDRVKALLAQKKAAHEAKYDARGSLFSGLRSELVPEVRALQQQYNELDLSYEMARQRSEQQAMTMARAKAARDVNNKLAAAGINERVSYRDVPDTQAVQYLNKNSVQVPQQSATNVATTIANAANSTAGGMFGVPNTQTTAPAPAPAPAPAVKPTPPAATTAATTAATMATTAATLKPAATTATQRTRTATPTATQTTRATPTATTGGGVYQGGLPPKQQVQPVVQQPMVQQPVPQQPVQQHVVGYVPPPVRDGYDMVGSAKDTILPGQPISRAVAREMYRNQAETNQLYNQMMSSARTAQVADAMNSPDTYRLAQELATQGLPADQAMYMAMAQVNAANQNWLGLGATIPAAQKGLSELNDYNMGTAMMFGVPFEQTVVRGPYNFNNPHVYSIDPNGTVTTSAGTFSNLTPEQMMALSVNNPTAVNQRLFELSMGIPYGNTYGTGTRNPGGTPQAVSAAANAAQNAQARADKQNGTAVTNQQQKATGW